MIDGEGGIWRDTDRGREFVGHDTGEGTMTEDTQQYLVWSNEHQAWWAPYECGYISIISQAGRYDRSMAARICQSANAYLAEGREPNEVMVLAPECIDTHVQPIAHGEGRAINIEVGK